MSARRAYGTGTLYARDGSWYGRWRAPGGARPHRRIGAVRGSGGREGLTRKQAERELRRLMDTAHAVARSPDRPIPTVVEMGELLLERLRARGRKKATLEAVASHLRVHICAFFDGRLVDAVDERDLEAFMAWMAACGKSPKTVRNVMGTMHSIFELARRRKLVAANPCQLIELPTVARDADIRFLDQAELEALLRAAPDDDGSASELDWWRVERVLYLAAAMTGMRQGELLALRWCDIDWLAHRARVRRSFVRGEFATPKSRRSTRSAPLAARLMGELDRHFQAWEWDGDEDLVFANPHTGRPMDRSKLLKRFKAACRRAGVREVRFHDLRHTFGTRMAASERVSMRTLQEWMGHRDFATTLIYADYQPGERESELVDAAFASPASALRAQRLPPGRRQLAREIG